VHGGRHDLLVTTKVGTEIFVDHDELRIGGSAGNTALALQGIGHPHRLVASVGADAFGDFLEGAFSKDSARLIRSEAATTVSVSVTHPDSERTFLTTRGHLPLFRAEEAVAMLAEINIAEGWLLLSGAFQTERLMEGYDGLIDYARARGARIAIDPGWPPEGWTERTRAFTRRLLSRSDCVLVNETEAAHLTGEEDVERAGRAIHMLQPVGGIAIVKCGPRGVIGIDGTGALHRAEAPKVKVADTIGAGDVFNAGYLAATCNGLPLSESLGQGVQLASTAISTNPRRYN
jgi:sugar/nucleoside kinase (ribokinase family)